jgi:hypothetical protein
MLNMCSGYKFLIVVSIVLIVLPVGLINAEKTASTMPAKSFIILLLSEEQLNLTEGYPFVIVIFAQDANNAVTIGYNGTLSLSVTGGSIVPNSVTMVNGHWTGQVTVNANDSTVITAKDNEGYSGSSNTLTIHTPNPTQPSSPTPTVPEFPIWIVLPFFAFVLLISVYIKYRRNSNE